MQLAYYSLALIEKRRTGRDVLSYSFVKVYFPVIILICTIGPIPFICRKCVIFYRYLH